MQLVQCSGGAGGKKVVVVGAVGEGCDNVVGGQKESSFGAFAPKAKVFDPKGHCDNGGVGKGCRHSDSLVNDAGRYAPHVAVERVALVHRQTVVDPTKGHTQPVQDRIGYLDGKSRKVHQHKRDIFLLWTWSTRCRRRTTMKGEGCGGVCLRLCKRQKYCKAQNQREPRHVVLSSHTVFFVRSAFAKRN